MFVIVTDDQGWGDVSSHGGIAPTPNMDRLGSDGVRLERFYATPVCSVTRSALLTGRSPNRTSVGNTHGLDLREHIMPQTFKAAGYQTFMCGKWHLGGLYNTDANTVINGITYPVIRENVDYQPQNRGWDVHYGEYTGAVGYTNHISREFGTLDWWLNGQRNLDQGWSTDLLADKAIQLFQQRDPSKPAIIYLAFNAVHGPVSAPTNYLDKYTNATGNRKVTLAAIDQMDVAMGRVLNAIDAEGITTNTLVIYFSDNGGQAASGGSNLPLRGDKGDLFDGGIHTPAAVRWPGVTNCQQFMWAGDWFPTLCAATGVTPLNTKPFDGTNMWPLLINASNGPFNPTNYRGTPLVSGSSAGSGIFDVFSNGTNLTMFKLIRDKLTGNAFSNSLFDIILDPYETNDLIANPVYTNIVTSLINHYNTLTAERYGPYIGVHPQSQSAPAGTNVTLYAMTTVYTTPVSFQWRRNGTNIPGATSYAAVDNSVYLTTLNLANVTAADAATYDVVVTNAATGWPNNVTSLPAVLTVLTNGGSFLTLTGVNASHAAPASNDAVRVTVNIASSTTVTQALLSYSTGAGASTTNTVFAETMALTATGGTGGWDGTGANNPWTHLTLAGAGNIKQTIGANHGSGNPCGLELSKGSSDPAQTMVTTASSINATGATGYVEFWVATVNVTNGLGWTFQLSTNGTTFITRLSETNGAVHAHQLFHYNLLPSERLSTLAMRFQFIGNGVGGPTAPKAQIDDITVVAATTGAATVNVAMADDGAHQDGAAGDGVYGGAIPAFPNGTTVSYYLTAANSGGQSATNPIGAPASQFSYTFAAAVVSNGWSMLTLPDTGQTTSYTTTPGEDSDYAINTPSYTDNGNGTTTDNVTGLMWQKADGGEMTISNALIFAQTTLNATKFAGYNDWRMPTVHELMSILNQDRSNPALDTNYFTSPGVVAGTWNQVYWWSRDQLRNGTNQWCANAGGGIGPKPITETISVGGTLNYRVRSVRGAPAPATNSPIHHLINNGNGTITDSDTGLTWQQAEIGATTDWTNALNYAEELTLGGFQDWRLPNIKELESLNDETLVSPSIDTNYFPNAESARYWSSTTQNNSTGNAWFNEFIAGITSQASKTSSYWVRAVRGGLANTAPALATISNRTVNAGVTVQFTNTASDAETAPGFLTYSLLTTTTGATLNATSGAFTWRSVVAQAGTTNLFNIVVADTGSPIQTAARSFIVTVNPFTEARVSPAGFSNGLFRLSIAGDRGPVYTVQASTNLTTWTNVFAANSPALPLNWIDTNSGIFLQRFYRVLLGP